MIISFEHNFTQKTKTKKKYSMNICMCDTSQQKDLAFNQQFQQNVCLIHKLSGTNKI